MYFQVDGHAVFLELNLIKVQSNVSESYLPLTDYDGQHRRMSKGVWCHNITAEYISMHAPPSFCQSSSRPQAFSIYKNMITTFLQCMPSLLTMARKGGGGVSSLENPLTAWHHGMSCQSRTERPAERRWRPFGPSFRTS